MDVQEIAALLAQYRARREQLRHVELSGMATLWEERERTYHLKQVDIVIALAEAMLERAAQRTASTSGARHKTRPVVAAQAPVEGARPRWDPIEAECYLPDVDEALLAAFEEGKER